MDFVAPHPQPPLSVLIIAFNEEINLAAALDSVVGWSDDIHVVDALSTDATVSIAKTYADRGVHLVSHPFKSFPDQLNWAIAELPFRHPWILRLDADERAREPFKREVSQLLASAPREAAFFLDWRFIFMGRWLRWGGLYPNGVVRLWRLGRARFETREVNEHLVVEGDVGYLKEPIDHEDLKPLSRWLERHVAYAAKEAKSILGRNLAGEVRGRLFGTPVERRIWAREVFYRIPFRSTLYFLYRYIFRLGFLDGRAGFRFAFLHASFFYWISLNISDARRTGRQPDLAGIPKSRTDDC